ncbi:MAG: cytochrome c oxidase subunit 3 [Bacteroidota bacterium]
MMEKNAFEDARGKFTGKLALFLVMITVAILFGTISMLYMLGPGKESLQIPGIFYLNTLLLILSSVLFHMGWVKGEEGGLKLLQPGIWIGILFLFSQVYGWYLLYTQGFGMVGSGQKVAYLYVLTGLHAIHLVAGLIFMAWVRKRLKHQGVSHLESAVFFWHFLGVLWVFLLVAMWTNA